MTAANTPATPRLTPRLQEHVDRLTERTAREGHRFRPFPRDRWATHEGLQEEVRRRVLLLADEGVAWARAARPWAVATLRALLGERQARIGVEMEAYAIVYDAARQ
ncbi:hypothetical protein F0L17_26580 [Streptomyces sp. TRM43335]|uniref:Uncharacterized protein n=2 Tax=Streptomyces taklimakanensis TaxID=2569853 RepID=A0A6G2BJY9_9ACTN|nr:hypothetical protein [Streptomyces taklimakanensis]